MLLRALQDPQQGVSGGGGELRLEELAELLDTGSLRPSVLSLDVFDTVLTRTCGVPADLFLWLGRRLFRRGIITCDPEVFARARHRAELYVWQREGGLDSHTGLETFHREVVHLLGMDQSVVSSLVDAELQLEAEVCRAVPAARDVVRAASARGSAVVFTSDTYLSTGFIEARLRSAGLHSAATRALISSEVAESKATGRLFRRLLTTDGRDAGHVLHVGDHPHSDVAVPRRVGIRSRWVPEGRLNRYERQLSAGSFATAGLASAFAGASRLARLTTPVETDHLRAIRDVAAGVAAPMLVGYVLWTLARARRASLRRLVFLARDGQVMAEIGRRLADRLGLSIEVSYLLVSRRSTNLAATFEATDEETAWVFRDLPQLSPDGLLDRFDLEWGDVAAHLAEPGTDVPETSVDLGPPLRQALRGGPVRELVLERATARRQMLVAYLRQEGLLDGTPAGLVDFGGVGSQVRALHAVIEAQGLTPPRIFLVGLDAAEDASLTPREEPAWLRDTETYLYDHRRGRGVRRARGFGTCVQMFCAADHGTVLGYSVEGTRVVPKMSSERDTEMLAWGLPTLRATIDAFVDNLTLSEDLVDPEADVRQVVCDGIGALWTEPDRDEAVAWGAFPFEGAQATDSAPNALAYPYTWKHISREVVAGGRFPDLGWQHWYEGSLALSPPTTRTLLRAAERLYRRLDHSSNANAALLTSTVRRLAGR